MCGIIGIFNREEAKESAIRGLTAMQNRGRDAYGLCNHEELHKEKTIIALSSSKLSGKNIIGHALHSIVGYCPQPIFERHAVFAANCEIYNWKELANSHNIQAQNDSELLFLLIQKKDFAALNELDGPYAFAYWSGKKVTICRDIIGEKPVWYSTEKGFAFASERKALLAAGYTFIDELNPRTILTYDIALNTVTTKEREFFRIKPETTDPHSIMKNKVAELLTTAITKRIPDQKVALLYSGGIDSLAIAYVLKKLEIPFTCYTASVDDTAKDVAWAKETAHYFGFDHKTAYVKLDDVPRYLKILVPLIEDSNVVKVGVGLTMFAACEAARKDGFRVIFSGLGSEELFAGYERHRRTLLEMQNDSLVNEDCQFGLLKMYERDLYRDDCITMHNNLELRLPFLDRQLVAYALTIPAKFKIDQTTSKLILRQSLEELGIPQKFAERKKIAAQYGSKFDWALQKLSKKHGFSSRSAYLRTFYPYPNVKLGVLFSSGKDSHLAMHTMKEQNYDIACLITLKSRNPDSYMFHTPTIEIAHLQAEALGIPLLMQETSGTKELELTDLEKAIRRAKEKCGIQGIVTGALYSNYQRSRIEKICDKVGLKIFCPLWHISQEEELEELLDKGYEFIMTGVASEGLDETWLGKKITTLEVKKLLALKHRIGFNVAGEGGEYESLVLFGPGYKKKIVIKEFSIHKDGSAARMIIKKAILEDIKPESQL